MTQSAATAFQGIDQPDTYAGTPLETTAERRARLAAEGMRAWQQPAGSVHSTAAHPRERRGRWTWTEVARDAAGNAIPGQMVERCSTDETVARIIARRARIETERRAFQAASCTMAPATWQQVDGSAHWSAS